MEALLGVLLLSVGIAVTVKAMARSLRVVSRSQRYTRACAAADNRLTALLLKDRFPEASMTGLARAPAPEGIRVTARRIPAALPDTLPDSAYGGSGTDAEADAAAVADGGAHPGVNGAAGPGPVRLKAVALEVGLTQGARAAGFTVVTYMKPGTDSRAEASTEANTEGYIKPRVKTNVAARVKTNREARGP